ncbi:MAG: hypothetical protein WDZ69_01730 [Candidatus Pacearchaeota archaeon]
MVNKKESGGLKLSFGKFSAHVSNRWLYTFIFIFAFAIAGVFVYAQTSGVSHSASEVTPGTFSSGDYVFPGDLDVDGQSTFKGHLNLQSNARIFTDNTFPIRSTSGSMVFTKWPDGNGFYFRTSDSSSFTSTYTDLFRVEDDGKATFFGDVCIGGVCKSGWPSGGESLWNQSESDIYYDGGNVGIGTISPVSKLHVNGSIRINHPGDDEEQWWLGEDNFITISSPGAYQEIYARNNLNIASGPSSSSGMQNAINFKIATSTRVKLEYSKMYPNTIGQFELGTEERPWSNLWANTKNFVIDHPLDPENKNLVHSSLEGPEIGVYYRGEEKLEKGLVIVRLPDYFEALTLEEGRTVHLTAKGDIPFALSSSEIKNGKFTVYGLKEKGEFYWEVKAVRSDKDPLQVEREKGWSE